MAIISAIPKLLDKLIYNRMLKFCLKSISETHGFISGRLAITNLILFTNSIFSSFDRNNQLDAIYLDFRKVFDLINHKILLLKLKYYNFSFNMIKWLENYLSNRNFYVQIKGTKSRKFIAPIRCSTWKSSRSFTIFVIY